MPTKILIVSGSTREPSRTSAIAAELAETAEAAGAEVRVDKLYELALPVFSAGDEAQKALPGVRRVRANADWADAFLLGTPEYHGSMSGGLKNWFDYLYPELAGKLAAVFAITGGGGGDMSITAAKNSVHWCHGFTLPFHAAARGADFEGETLVNAKVRDRLIRMVHDLVRYAPPLRAAFTAGMALGKDDPRAGFAGFHA